MNYSLEQMLLADGLAEIARASGAMVEIRRRPTGALAVECRVEIRDGTRYFEIHVEQDRSLSVMFQWDGYAVQATKLRSRE